MALNSTMINISTISEIIQKDQPDSILIAYSGGVDSHVLLHLLASLRAKQPTLKLRAIHVNHGISPKANEWQTHCKKTCESLQVNLLVKKINPSKKANEAQLREKRYKAFADVLQPNEYLLTAHTKTDQAETVFLQLLRGAGPAGLAAMPEIAKFSDGYLLRPLLNYTKNEILEYAKENKLDWIEDDSNLDIRFDRNFLRQKIFPILKENWPSLETTFARSAKHCASAAKILNEKAAEDLSVIMNGDKTLAINKLLTLSSERQANLLRAWLHQQNLPLPSSVKIQRIQNEVLTAREDASPLVVWPGAEIRRYRNQLFAMQPLTPHDSNLVIPWNSNEDLVLPNNLGTIKAIPEFAGKNLVIRFRQGGEQCKIHNREGTHSVKKLMQEWGIPPWLRNRIPLIYLNDQLIKIIKLSNCSPPRHTAA